MAKLEKLSAEQEAMLPSFVEYGLRIGLSTERSDRVAGTAAIKAHYHACGLKEPEVRWFDSPYASVWDSVEASVRASVGDSVEASVWASVRASVGDSVRASVGDSVWASIRASVGDSVRASVWASVGASVWASVRASVRASVWASVGASVWDSVGAHYDADYAAWFMAWDRYGISLPAAAFTFMRVCEEVWWFYPGLDVVLASDRPIAIRRDQEGRLHHETGKSVEFMDGSGLSSWHGQTIPDAWVTGSPPSAADAVTWRNMDQRAAACEIIGWHNIMDELGARTIDADADPAIGSLVEINLPDHGPQKMLDVMCGTGRRFALLAPDEATTALQAQAILNDVPEWVVKDLRVRT